MAARLAPAVGAGALAALVALDVYLPDWVLIAVCAVSYACGAYGSPRAGVLGVTILLAALVASGDSWVPFALATLGPWIAGRIVRSRQALVAALAARTRELEAEQDAFARLAVRRERARIALELHDIVAHHLAVMVIHAGAGRMGSTGDERLASIRHAGDQALVEMTRLVAMLQSDADERRPASGQLQILVEQARATGLDLRATPLPPGVQLPAAVAEAVYRLVQEGLTNAMKHAPGSVVELRLAVRAGTLEIELVNGSSAAPSELAKTGGGLGLAGMRDRIEALGGSLDAGPAPGAGWRVCARVPAG